MPISPNRSLGSIRATTLSRRSIGLAIAIARRPAHHEVERIRGITFVEQDVSADQVPLVARGCDAAKCIGVCISEEVGAGQGSLRGP